MNRLLAEKNNPQADVHWAKVPIRAEMLNKKRSQRLINRPAPKASPRSSKIRRDTGLGFPREHAC